MFDPNWPTRSRHGTTAGWRAHQKLDVPVCEACRAAKADYDRRRRQAPEIVNQARDRAAAQGAALQRLKDRYLAEYQELYERECQIRGMVAYPSRRRPKVP